MWSAVVAVSGKKFAGIHTMSESPSSFIWTSFLHPEKGYNQIRELTTLSDHKSLTNETAPNFDGAAINSLRVS